ncbi:cell wall integrity and stress response component 2 [Drosophila miranda]|uniref:cell wall integrity and stress response component 2 n=1 Tax=Drosophila miranda TaxID=7229 RepID=UPI00143F9482|nr:cell wall integrity and stress response component 2 [Drosophila miranda]
MLRLLFCLGMGILGCQAACNVCSSWSNTACVSETSFKFCNEAALLIGDATPCKNGFYCTGEAIVCQNSPALTACITEINSSSTESTTGTTESNTSSAESTKSPTVTSSSSTESTTGTTESNTSSAESTKSPTVTSSSSTESSTGTTATITITASTPTPETTTIAASTPTTVDPAIIDICRIKATTGRYTNPNDSTGRSYVMCFYRGSTWSGAVWECPLAKPYFNSTTSVCSSTKPSNCV